MKIFQWMTIIFKWMTIILSILLLISCIINIKLIVYVFQNYNTVKMGIRYVDYISGEVGIDLPSDEYSTDILFMDAHDWWFGEGTSAAVIGLNSSENERFRQIVETDNVRWEKVSNMSDDMKEHLFIIENGVGYLNKSVIRSESGYYCIYNKCTSKFNESDIFDKCWSFTYIQYNPQDSVIYIHDFDD